MINLQELDSLRYDIKHKLDAIPKEIKNKDDEFAAKKVMLRQLEEKAKELLLQKNESEIELKSKEGNIDKLQKQLSQIKTNKEYTAMLKEIEGSNADKSCIEDKILSILMDLDKLKEETDKAKSFLAEEEKKLAGEKDSLRKDEKVLRDKLDVLRGKRGQIISHVAPDILGRYERILENKHGLALVRVVNNACQGCFMNVPHQVVNEIRMHERLIVCDMCARILYEQSDS